MNELRLGGLHERHPGLTPALGQCYAEAASVCLSRHHQPPVTAAVNHSGISEPKVVNFDIPDARVSRAHANEIDATEIGAYGLSLAAIEAVAGLVAVRRAETLTGSDWYIAPAGTDSQDLENCIRLEVSGINAGGSKDIKSRLSPEQGFPLRLVVPGWQGINNVKWLRRIDLVDEPYMSMMEATKYPSLKLDGKSRWFELELGPKSVITRPSGGHHLPVAGFYEITGLAWSGGGAIRRVEVSTDGGRTWKDAKLHDPVVRKAHTRFSIPWNWNGEDAVLQSRCTDDLGVVQPSLAEVAKLRGEDLNYFRTLTASVGDFNAIQPWKVNRDGSVQNAIF